MTLQRDLTTCTFGPLIESLSKVGLSPPSNSKELKKILIHQVKRKVMQTYYTLQVIGEENGHPINTMWVKQPLMMKVTTLKGTYEKKTSTTSK
jgi:hypothetical protein